MIKKIDGTVVRVTTYQGGAMRKYGSWRIEQEDAERELLNRIAARVIAPMGNHGLVVRKKVKI